VDPGEAACIDPTGAVRPGGASCIEPTPDDRRAGTPMHVTAYRAASCTGKQPTGRSVPRRALACPVSGHMRWNARWAHNRAEAMYGRRASPA